MIVCKCPVCGEAYELETAHVGQKLRCAGCERAFVLDDAAGRTSFVFERHGAAATPPVKPPPPAAARPSPPAEPPAVPVPPPAPRSPRAAYRLPPWLFRRRPGERVFNTGTVILVGAALVALLVRLLAPAPPPARHGQAARTPPGGHPVAPAGAGVAISPTAPAPVAVRPADTTTVAAVEGDDVPSTGGGTEAPPGEAPPPAPVTLRPDEVQQGVVEEDLPRSPAEQPGYIEKTTSPAVGPGPGDRSVAPDRLAEFLKVLAREKYAWTRDVRLAYFKLQQAETRDALQRLGKTLPADFLAWVDQDPVVSATIYGVRAHPENVLLALYALQLDVGEATIRHCTQLALAAAILNEKQGPAANIAPHPLVRLRIPPCPLQPVDTRDPGRKLDVNDHIINFLNGDYRLARQEGGKKPRNPHHENDGCVQPFRFEKGLPPEPEGLIATDVIKDDHLKDLLAEYLKSKGCPLAIPHGELESPATYVNFETFHNAYVAKGLLPAEREPPPSTAERLLFLARNAEHAPFPLKKAPWPVLTLLFEVSLPLREAEEIWTAYRKEKRYVTYGNYIGPIAQNAVYLAATDLRPFPFSCKARSWQAMLKNGGVCGTMAALAVGTYNTLGIPAVTAGQPGHCALISYTLAGRVYTANIEQSVTGGPAETTPHAGWPLGEARYGAPQLYVYRECVAKALNRGFDEYLDSCVMHSIYRLVPPDVREQHGFELLRNGLALNPYNTMLTDALSEVGTALQLAEIHRWFDVHVAAGHKAGLGLSDVYRDKVCRSVFSRIASLPVDADKANAEVIFKALSSLTFAPGELALLDNLERVTLGYQAKALGLRDFLAEMTKAFTAHFESSKPRYPALCQAMARRLKYAAALVPDEGERKQWLERLAKRKHNNEDYTAFGRLQVDRRDKYGTPINFHPGLGGLTLQDGGSGPVNVHFVLGNGADGYEVLRDKDNAATQSSGKPSDKPESAAYARTMLRDEVSDAIDELLGLPRKPLTGVSALLTGAALKDRKEASAALAFLDKTRFRASDPTLGLRYTLAALGEEKFLAEQLERYKKYAAPTGRNELESKRMAQHITVVAGLVADGPAKRAWLERMRKAIKSRESYRSRWRLQTTDARGYKVPEDERLKLEACPQAFFRDETVAVLDTLLGGSATAGPPAVSVR